MNLSKLELAVLNNIHWYQAMFLAHGLASTLDERLWWSHQSPPPFHSNLVVRSPTTTLSDVAACVRELEIPPRPVGWSMKDSYARLDMLGLGFEELFNAEWIWRDPQGPVPHPPTSRLSWSRVTTTGALGAWEDAWSGDATNNPQAAGARQFPEPLLASTDHAFFAGHLDGQLVAGGIANLSPGVVGLSNLFATPALADQAWTGLVNCISAAFPNLPIVGYERGADLQQARHVGFESIGKLRIWCRAA